MIAALVLIFASLASWLISYLPAGPDLGEGVTDLITGGVSFLKSLDKLIPLTIEIGAVTVFLTYEIAKMAFRSVEWIFNKVRGAG